MIKGRFPDEQQIIDAAISLKHCIPNEVKTFLSHFIRNDLTILQLHCRTTETENLIQHIAEVLRTIEI